MAQVASKQPLLLVEDLSFAYRDRRVLAGVSFNAAQATALALLGPNGSGKSTLLKSLLGLVAPVTGKIRLDGIDLSSMSRRDLALKIGYVPQDSVVRFPFTGLEYVLQGRFARGKILGFESDEDVRQSQRAMEATGTTAFVDRLITQLSGGERQRLMLARALALEPRLLLLDEPLANLDIANQVKLLTLVRDLCDSRSITAIVVTHDLNLAAEFAQRVVMLREGQILAQGAPEEVFTPGLLQSLFGADLFVDDNPLTGARRVTPITRPSTAR